MQGQSAFLRHCRRFFFNDFKIWIFPPPRSAKRTPRDLSKKKKLYAKTQPVLSRNYSRNWAFPNYFLSRLPHSAGAAETSVSVSVKNFIISWKYTISVLLNLGGLRSKLLNSSAAYDTKSCSTLVSIWLARILIVFVDGMGSHDRDLNLRIKFSHVFGTLWPELSNCVQ